MGRAVRRAVQTLLGMAMFLCATLTFVKGWESVAALQAACFEGLNDSQVMYEAAGAAGDKNITITREELCARMMQEQAYDVRIDGTEIEAATYSSRMFDFSILSRDRYLVSYGYDAQGAITKVVYTGM